MERTPKDFHSQAQAERIIRTALQVIKDAVANGEKVYLSGFGMFKAVERAERTYTLPATGEQITYPATVVPVFHAKKAFRDQCRDGMPYQP